MKRIFIYDDYRYEYYVEFGERKSLTLIVRPDQRIIVRAPVGTETGVIEAFLKRKWQWLEKQLRELRRIHKTHPEKLYVSGESFFYLGRQYMLLVEHAQADRVRLERGKLRVYTTKSVRNGVHNRKLVEDWLSYRRDIIFKQEYIKALALFDYASRPRFRERIMARRWGSYTSDNTVSLNPKLIQAPKEAIYYVCVHELCHVANRLHDKEFYTTMDKKLPNWREIKEGLEVRYG